MWVQTDKYIKGWLRSIRKRRIKSPGRPPLLTLHQPPTIESNTHKAKKTCSSKNCTQLDCLPLEHLFNIDMWHVGLVDCNKLERIMVKLTEHYTFLLAYTSYELKYTPFDYYTNYDHIKYAWEDI